jgi:Secretion system C-terminal sorting domain
MKKQLLTLGLALMTAGLFAQWSDNPAADSSRNAVTIDHVTSASLLPTIDGSASEAVWKSIAPVKIDRLYSNGNAGARPVNEPTFYSCWFKAFYTDTVIYVLVHAADNSFWPAFMVPDKGNSYKYDKVELYFGANGIGFDGYGASTGAANGCYQVTKDYDSTGHRNVKVRANWPDAYVGQDVKWYGTDSVVETTEWSVNMKDLTAKGSTDKLDPTSTPQILFDVNVSDADSAGDLTIRRRQLWSNVGHGGNENWASMDSAGVLTFSGNEVPLGVNQNTTSNVTSLVLPTITTGMVTIQGADLNAIIYNALGQPVLQSNNSTTLDLSGLTNGLYIVKIGKYSSKVLLQK